MKSRHVSREISKAFLDGAGVIAVSLVVLGLFWLVWDRTRASGPRPDAYLLRIPGDYTLHLRQGTYDVWKITNWRAQHIEGAPDALALIEIYAANGERLHGESINRVFYDSERAGLMDFSFQAQQSGLYKISCSASKQLVVAIVPHGNYDSQAIDAVLVSKIRTSKIQPVQH